EQETAIYRLPAFDEVAKIRVTGLLEESAVSQDLRSLAMAVTDRDLCRVLVCDLASKSELEAFSRLGRKVLNLEISTDGTVLLASWDDGGITLWSIAKNEPLPSPQWESSETIDRTWPSPLLEPNSTRVFVNRSTNANVLEVW